MNNCSKLFEASPHLHIAIPAMNELEYLPLTLQAINNQESNYKYTIYICVNQPDNWWQEKENEKFEVCKNNEQLLLYLAQLNNDKIKILDFSSKGKGWTRKKYGVGWARKVLFDHILKIAREDDLIISLDADTLIPSNYFQLIGDFFNTRPTANVLSVPYFHPLGDNYEANLAILRYEIYMRCYLINMFLINSPYAFTAIGSAIVIRIRALRKIGGITPMKSGEDFYLLQKLRKMGHIHQWLPEVVKPAARFSNRVFFGTGPAILKGAKGDWTSYPIYHPLLFQEIKKNYELIPTLFHEEIDTPFITFLKQQFQDENLWQPLRKNSKNIEQFTKAFHEKADGLRILQFFKVKQKELEITDEKGMIDSLSLFFGTIPDFLTPSFSFEELTTEQLNILREQLFAYEMLLRKRNDEHIP
jgi:cellulose synthase/poly-beta-1,6-N-acetylglucosamine synthase-like glycosyltransferase